MEIDQKNSLILSRKAACWVSAGLILSGGLIFSVGYFMGYRHALLGVQNQIQQVSLNDQAAQVLSEGTAQDVVADDSEKWNGDLEMEQVLPTAQDSQQAANLPSEIVNNVDIVATANAGAGEDVNNPTGVSYYAELIGFGYQKAAQDFVAKAGRKGYPVRLIEKSNRTSAGKVVTWYQVVTEKFDDKAKLEQLVRTIKRTEHLQGIKIKQA